jgi:hypothetical protein
VIDLPRRRVHGSNLSQPRRIRDRSCGPGSLLFLAVRSRPPGINKRARDGAGKPNKTFKDVPLILPDPHDHHSGGPARPAIDEAAPGRAAGTRPWRITMTDARSKANGSDYLGHAMLRTRGWTDPLISRFLAEPDVVRVNPFYASHPPRKLYLLERVEAIERTPEFLVAKRGGGSRGVT